jgi:hypothetical protein
VDENAKEENQKKAARVALGMLYDLQLMVPFFPKGDDATQLIFNNLMSMVKDPDTELYDAQKMDWIRNEAVSTLRVWEGIPCLKDIADRYERKDRNHYGQTKREA